MEAVFFRVEESLTIILLLSLPPLACAAVVGLAIGLVQAVTQIQDQTLPQVAKLIAVIVVIVFAGPALTGPLLVQARDIFETFHLVGR